MPLSFTSMHACLCSSLPSLPAFPTLTAPLHHANTPTTPSHAPSVPGCQHAHGELGTCPHHSFPCTSCARLATCAWRAWQMPSPLLPMHLMCQVGDMPMESLANALTTPSHAPHVPGWRHAHAEPGQFPNSLLFMHLPWQVGDLSMESLAYYCGYDFMKPILVSVRGVLYDASNRGDLYGPGKELHVYAGKEVGAVHGREFETCERSARGGGVGALLFYGWASEGRLDARAIGGWMRRQGAAGWAGERRLDARARGGWMREQGAVRCAGKGRFVGAGKGRLLGRKYGGHGR
eukprot:364801-Chlamydomonas_euryale.AAC.3